MPFCESKKKTAQFIYSTLFVICLSACKPNDQVINISQVVAKVNGDEITANQVNAELRKVKAKSGDPSAISAKVLESMISRQLLVQEATKLNLDRMPEVQDSIASAKAQIYAQTYIASKLAKLSVPTEDEVKQFVAQHPHYFQQRRVYITQDVLFENRPQTLDLNWLEANVTTIDQLKSVLNEKGIQYRITHNQFATDTLPDMLSEKINHVKTGDLIFAHDDNNFVIKLVTSIVPSPVTETQSLNMAAKILVEQRNQKFVAKEIERLKSLAKIEIMEPSLTHAPNELLSNP